MKLTLLLCLILVLANLHITLAKKKGGGGLFGKLFDRKPKHDIKSKPNQFNHGGSTHRQDIPGTYQRPQQPAQPAPGSPYAGGGGHGSYGGQGGGHPGQGGYGAYGSYGGGYAGYPGGYINQNPNNHILSPHYGGSFGYGGYGAGGGSPFSRSVQSMGYIPSDKSKGFGRSAMMAAAGGAVAGMAVGYGLGRFPRPHLHFHSPEEEYYYNYYMYRKYGLKSTDANDYSRDYSFKAPADSYEKFMELCMKRKDLLPTPKKISKPIPTRILTTTTTTAVPSTHPTGNITETKNATVNNSTDPPLVTSSRPKMPEDSPGANNGPAAMAILNTAADNDDDTVSVVEIGYPALIEQLKVRRCLELYMVYSEKYLRKNTPPPPNPNTNPNPRGGGQRLEMSSHCWLIVLASAIMIIMNVLH